MLLCHKNQPSAMHRTVCSQYMLAHRYIRNSGYLCERRILSTFDFEMAVLRCFFVIKVNLLQCIPCDQYISADKFLRNIGYLVERGILSTFDFKMAALRCFLP